MLFLTAALAACGHAANEGSAATNAESITKAVYANDVDGVTASFDAPLKAQVSRAAVGLLSDKMHALGAYKNITLVSSDPAKNEYVYRANFDRGSMNVAIRLDADGKVAAYRIFPTGA